MSETYRTEWPLIGHAWAVNRLARSMNAGRLRHAYLISGPAGIGKTTFARLFAQAANCLAESGRPCGQCRACRLIASGNHADFTLIEADQGTLKIEQVREMGRLLSLRPVEGRYRVVLFRRFQEASTQAMDALLKTLEEPPPYVLILLTADATESLLPTIRSRCQPITLRLLPPQVIRAGLEAHYGLSADDAALLAQLSGGRVGWAIRAYLDEIAEGKPDRKTIFRQRAEWLDTLEAAISMTRRERFALAGRLSEEASRNGKADLMAMLDLWQSYWRDALLLAHHSVLAAPINRDRRHGLDQVARGAGTEGIYRALTAVRRTAKYLEANVNTRLALEVLLLDIPTLKIIAPPPESS